MKYFTLNFLLLVIIMTMVYFSEAAPGKKPSQPAKPSNQRPPRSARTPI
uniref:2.7 kDa salivary peptide n=1 Tax=Phlebotomus arabicus TaxID=578135 RepID=C6G4E3_9DIPT